MKCLSRMTAELCFHVGARLFLSPSFCRLLADMVMHFPMSQEEVTLSTSSLRVSLRNYCEDGKSELSRTQPLATATLISATGVACSILSQIT